MAPSDQLSPNPDVKNPSSTVAGAAVVSDMFCSGSALLATAPKPKGTSNVASISSMDGGVGAAAEGGMRPRQRRKPGDYQDSEGRKRHDEPPAQNTAVTTATAGQTSDEKHSEQSIKIHQHCTDDERVGLMLDLFV